MTTSSCRHCSAATDGLALCAKCLKTVQHALTNIAADYSDLDRASTAAVRRRGTTISDPTWTRVGAVRIDPISAADHAATNALTTWARALIDDRPQACLPPRTVPELAVWLSDRLTSVATLAWAGDLSRDLLGIERQLKRVADQIHAGNYLGVCGAVRQLDDEATVTCTAAIYARTDRAHVTCTCGQTWDTRLRRQQLVRDAEDELLPVAGIARLAAVFTGEVNVARVEARIRQWAHRGDVEVADIQTISGRPRKVYRVGDVLDLLARDTPQRTSA